MDPAWIGTMELTTPVYMILVRSVDRRMILETWEFQARAEWTLEPVAMHLVIVEVEPVAILEERVEPAEVVLQEPVRVVVTPEE